MNTEIPSQLDAAMKQRLEAYFARERRNKADLRPELEFTATQWAPHPKDVRSFLPCANALVWNDKHQLASVSRRNAPHLFCLPGGKVEQHLDGDVKSDNHGQFYAALRRGAARELFEEAGLVTDSDKLQLVFSTHSYEDAHVHTFCFFAKEWTGELRAEKGLTAQWSNPEFLLNNTPWPEYFRRLFDALGVKL